MATKISADGLPGSSATDDLRSLHRKSLAILKRLQTHALDPETGEKAGPTFPISKAAELVDRTASAIRRPNAMAVCPSAVAPLRVTACRTISPSLIRCARFSEQGLGAIRKTRRRLSRCRTSRAASASRRSRCTLRSTLRLRGTGPCSSTATARPARP